MMRFFLFIKHHFSFIWILAEFCNGILFRLLYWKKFSESINSVCAMHSSGRLIFRPVHQDDIVALSVFFHQQPEESYRYFKPHDFDEKTLLRLWRNPSFFQLLVTTTDNLFVGYFMIRCFANRQAFAGFLVDQNFQGNGIAKEMCRVIFEVCWPNHFRTFATVSRANQKALSAYRAINDFTILKELPDNYIYIEYTQKK